MKTLSMILVPLVPLAPACKKKAPEPMASEVEAPAPALAMTTAEAVKTMTGHFAKVHFELDSSTLTAESKTALSANAALMQQHPRITIEVQGHADERGTVDYNIALGQRRAKAVSDYLSAMGVGSARVNLVSYGEEDPIVRSSGEVAWSQNRRCEFRILVGEAGVEGSR